MKNITKRTLKFGQKSMDVSYNPFDNSGHVDYSGFGVHGKAKTAKNRENRREAKREGKNAIRGMAW